MQEVFNFTDPSYFDNTRCVFELPMRMTDAINPDIQISNVGCLFAPDGGAGGAKLQVAKYPVSLGIKSCIRNINLSFNNVPLQELHEHQNILSLLNLKTTNGAGLDMKSELDRSRTSYFSQAITGVVKIVNKDYSDAFVTDINDDINNMALAKNVGIISLVDYFSVLQEMLKANVLIYSKYITLRVEIEWETDITSYFLSFATGAQNTPTDAQLTFSKPVMITKRTSDRNVLEELEKQYSEGLVIPFTTWQTERVNLIDVPQADYTHSVAANTFTLKSVTDLTCKRAIVQTRLFAPPATPYTFPYLLSSTNSAQLGCKFHSAGNNLEKLKVTMNSMPLFPYEGIDTPALKRLYRNMALNDTLQLVQKCDNSLYIDDAQTNEMNYVNDTGAQSYLQSYYAFNLPQQPITSLEVSYSCYSSAGLFIDPQPEIQLWHFEVIRGMSLSKSSIVVGNL